MLDRKLKIAVKGINQAFISGQALKGCGRNEIGGVLRHQHMHVGMQLFQHPSHIWHLVGGYPASDPQQHCFSL
jgi:hypothetical protein